MNDIAFITTFPNNMYDVYAKQMLESFMQFMPSDTPLMVQLDDDLLAPNIDKILRPQDGIAIGWDKEHASFVARNKDKDDPQNYRKQPVRFCHKVFAIDRAYQATVKQKSTGEPAARYLIWLDADVLITKPVSLEDIKKCLPIEGDAVAYMGRKDWEHSECGWLAFDLDNNGDKIIERMVADYASDLVLKMEQQHDSWVFDDVTKHMKVTNLTDGKPGMEIWPQSPMASWSIHYKGPIAKQQLYAQKQPLMPNKGQNFVIQTKNAIPHEQLRKHIEENQALIPNWVKECLPNDETIVLVSAGPQLIAEDLRLEINAGRKIVAVKHALEPLHKAGIKPWACILLDPRPHVIDFVTDADIDVKWFVASQVNPEVTKSLLLKGCEVWGYHASVGAEEGHLTIKQPSAVVDGGSATATRGLHLLAHLGFRNFRLYGYELSLPDKPDLNAKDNLGQPKYMEFSLRVKTPLLDMKRSFFSEPQLIAQYEEINQIINNDKYSIEAFGDGMVPYMLKMTRLARLRQEEIKCKMSGRKSSYKRLFRWSKTKKTKSSLAWLRICWPTRLRLPAKNR